MAATKRATRTGANRAILVATYRAQGDTWAQAAVKAGYTAKNETDLAKCAIRAVQRVPVDTPKSALEKVGVTDITLAATVGAGLVATRPMRFGEEVEHVPDWSSRARFADLAARARGWTQEQGQTNLTLQVGVLSGLSAPTRPMLDAEVVAVETDKPESNQDDGTTE